MLDNMVRRYGADHVVMGTDYPFDMGSRIRWDSSSAASSAPRTRRRSWAATPPGLLKIRR
jgi:hypothetical protein